MNEKRILVSCALCLTAGLFSCSAAETKASEAKVPAGYKLLYSQDFEKEEAIRDFEFTDPSRWKIGRRDGNGYLEFLGGDKYRPKVRSPIRSASLRTRYSVISFWRRNFFRRAGNTGIATSASFSDSPIRANSTTFISQAEPTLMLTIFSL